MHARAEKKPCVTVTKCQHVTRGKVVSPPTLARCCCVGATLVHSCAVLCRKPPVCSVAAVSNRQRRRSSAATVLPRCFIKTVLHCPSTVSPFCFTATVHLSPYCSISTVSPSSFTSPVSSCTDFHTALLSDVDSVALLFYINSVVKHSFTSPRCFTSKMSP